MLETKKLRYFEAKSKKAVVIGIEGGHYFTERNRFECTYDCQKCRMRVEMR